VPGDGGAVRGERGQRGEVVTAFPRDRQRGGQEDGRLEATALPRPFASVKRPSGARSLIHG